MLISDSEVHVWLAFSHQIQQPELLRKYHQLMNADERGKLQRFRFARHQHEYLVTRAVLRTVLSKYGPREPQDWVFQFNDYGRPELIPGQSVLPLRFSLSHTEGLIACAVTLDKDVGVDVETISRSGETVLVADRYFSPFEVESLSGGSGSLDNFL